MRYAPSPRAMNTGWPPTPPKARAGLLTPPGITRLARANASLLRGRWFFIGLGREELLDRIVAQAEPAMEKNRQGCLFYGLGVLFLLGGQQFRVAVFGVQVE